MFELLNYFKNNEIIDIRFLKNLKLYIVNKNSNCFTYRLSSSTIEKSHKIINLMYYWDWILINEIINYV